MKKVSPKTPNLYVEVRFDCKMHISVQRIRVHLLPNRYKHLSSWRFTITCTSINVWRMTIEVQPYSLFAKLLHKIVTLTVYASILVLPEISFPNRLNLSPTGLCRRYKWHLFRTWERLIKNIRQFSKTSVECKQKVTSSTLINTCKQGEIKIKKKIRPFVPRLGSV